MKRNQKFEFKFSIVLVTVVWGQVGLLSAATSFSCGQNGIWICDITWLSMSIFISMKWQPENERKRKANTSKYLIHLCMYGINTGWMYVRKKYDCLAWHVRQCKVLLIKLFVYLGRNAVSLELWCGATCQTFFTCVTFTICINRIHYPQCISSSDEMRGGKQKDWYFYVTILWLTSVCSFLPFFIAKTNGSFLCSFFFIICLIGFDLVFEN